MKTFLKLLSKNKLSDPTAGAFKILPLKFKLIHTVSKKIIFVSGGRRKVIPTQRNRTSEVITGPSPPHKARMYRKPNGVSSGS